MSFNYFKYYRTQRKNRHFGNVQKYTIPTNTSTQGSVVNATTFVRVN